MDTNFQHGYGTRRGLALTALASSLLLPVLGGLGSCAAADSVTGSGLEPGTGEAWGGAPISEATSLDSNYAVVAAYKSDVRVNGVAAGELDPDHPGDEIVAVDHVGRVHIIARVDDAFGHATIATASATGGGELVQVAVGDLLPSAPGQPAVDEIVAVGAYAGTEDDPGPGIIRVFYRGVDGTWTETSYVTPGLVHAVTVGDVGLAEGEQFVCAGFFRQALVGSLTTEVRGGGVALGIGAVDLPEIGNVKGVALTDEGFVLAADDGQSVEVVIAPGEFRPRAPVQHGSSLARVGFSKDVGVLLADNDGFLRVISQGEQPTSSILERSEQRLRGAVFLDIDPTSAGLEACSAGYDGRVRVVALHRVEDPQLDLPDQAEAVAWEGDVTYVARDSAKLHHLSSGNLAGIGACLISCGYSGDVLLIHRKDG